ncbi:hypothetical protein KKI24_02385, partial [bacterium]|nr:hypothetical protein [bacterium]
MSDFWHDFTIGALFKPESIFIDQDGDGYPDELGLTICIDPMLNNSDVWSGILNLVCRLTFEIVTFPPCLVQNNLIPADGKKRRLIILSPGTSPSGYQGLLGKGTVFRPNPETIY